MVLHDGRADRRVGDVESRVIAAMAIAACVADTAASCLSCGSGASRVTLHRRVLPVGRSSGKSRTRLPDARSNPPWSCQEQVEGVSCRHRCIISSFNRVESNCRTMKRYIALAVFLTIAGLGFRLFLALHLPTDEPDDGRLYARIAINLLEHHSYSTETEEPYSPTLIRVPGYPLFMAGVYAV